MLQRGRLSVKYHIYHINPAFRLIPPALAHLIGGGLSKYGIGLQCRSRQVIRIGRKKVEKHRKKTAEIAFFVLQLRPTRTHPIVPMRWLGMPLTRMLVDAADDYLSKEALVAPSRRCYLVFAHHPSGPRATSNRALLPWVGEKTISQG
jgi:hypothetical protein